MISPHHPSVVDLAQAVDDSSPTCEVVRRKWDIATKRLISEYTVCDQAPATNWVQFTADDTHKSFREKFACAPCLQDVIRSPYNTIHRIEKL
jgi:hypothetical protein